MHSNNGERMVRRSFVVFAAAAFFLAMAVGGAFAAMLEETGVSPGTGVDIMAGSIGEVDAQAGYYQIVNQSNPGVTLNGFCVSPVYSASGYNSYTLTPIAAGTSYQAAAYILSNGPSKGWDQVAEQIAVWELVWDWTDGVNLKAGVFQLLNGSYTTYADAATNIINDALANYSTFDASKYLVAQADGNYQSYVIPTPAPVPAAILFFAPGLLGLAGLRKRIKIS